MTVCSRSAPDWATKPPSWRAWSPRSGAWRSLRNLLSQRKAAIRALAVEQRAAELALEKLDRPRQRRLRDVAALGGAGEVQFLGDRQEIADLVHLHSVVPRPPHRAASQSAPRIRNPAPDVPHPLAGPNRRPGP